MRKILQKTNVLYAGLLMLLPSFIILRFMNFGSDTSEKISIICLPLIGLMFIGILTMAGFYSAFQVPALFSRSRRNAYQQAIAVSYIAAVCVILMDITVSLVQIAYYTLRGFTIEYSLLPSPINVAAFLCLTVFVVAFGCFVNIMSICFRGYFFVPFILILITGITLFVFWINVTAPEHFIKHILDGDYNSILPIFAGISLVLSGIIYAGMWQLIKTRSLD